MLLFISVFTLLSRVKRKESISLPSASASVMISPTYLGLKRACQIRSVTLVSTENIPVWTSDASGALHKTVNLHACVTDNGNPLCVTKELSEGAREENQTCVRHFHSSKTTYSQIKDP